MGFEELQNPPSHHLIFALCCGVSLMPSFACVPCLTNCKTWLDKVRLRHDSMGTRLTI